MTAILHDTLDVEYTARMEDQLDEVESAEAAKELDETCENLGRPMVAVPHVRLVPR